MKKFLKGNSRLSIALVAVLALTLITCVFAVATAAGSSIETVGEMVDIKSTFAQYLAQDTVRLADDGYVGEMQYTAYYDTSKGTVKTGYEGTPVVIYTINHPGIERVGTDSNETIIQSMLDRGYIVVVLDYLNNEKAVSPAIDWSSQQFRTDLRNGKRLTNKSVFPGGNYDENFLAPSGCNVLLHQVFWEIDKHSTSGTLEKIVENWNSDFRATKGSKFIEWVHEDGTRKAVQNDLDGNAPVWYNASQQVDPNGTYTYIRFTKAETITDCVDPDGSFIDMNLYINVVYPTNPEKEVPVMSLANSSGHPTTSVTGADLRPHSNGFLYNGYANVVFDYLWVPMARSASWGYYDGSQGITQDHMNYAVMMYNDKLVNTAAMRYLRYISLTGGTTYNFDLDAFGVYGNSKGGWFSFLGEEAVQSPLATGNYATELEKLQAIDLALAAFTPDRYYNGKHGATRYQEGEGVITKDGFTLKAGELQPWLTTPDGTEIISGCQLTYAQNGSQQEDITAGHSPVFVSSHMNDTYNAAYGYSNDIVNICRELDIPLLNFELNLGHTLAYDYDMKYGTDSYDAFFRYVNFYLNGGALTVAYTDPYNNDGDIAVTNDIVIRFAGAVSASEIAKVTVKAAGVTVNGTWSSQFGGTEWTFTPEMLVGGTKYTVTIPADLQGTNGNKMASEYAFEFITEFDAATAITETVGATGRYYSFNAPALTTGNSFVFRFSVSNKAANVAELYAVDSLDATSGTLLGTVNLRGIGSYEIDITDYIAQRAGESTVLLLKTGKAIGDTVVVNESFDTTGSYSKGSYVTLVAGSEIAGEKALKATITANVTKGVSVYQDNTTHVLTYGKITGGYKTTADQLGRTYTIELDIYDTISRTVQLKLNSMTKRVDYGTIDYDHKLVHVTTKANEWTHVAITYTVYEADYGKPALGNVQSLAVYISPDGDTKAPIYFNDLVVTEHVTDMNVVAATVAEKNDGTGAYLAAASSTPFVVYNGTTKVGEYATWKAAFAAYKNGYTVKLQRDYTLTDNDLYSDFEAFTSVKIDLGGYTVTCANTKNSLLWLKNTGKTDSKTYVSVSNGAVLLDRTPLLSYESSTAKGVGKSFDVTLSGVYLGLVDLATTTELLSANTCDVKTNVNINLTDCTIDIDSYNRPYDSLSVLTAPADDVINLSYKVTGGAFKLNCARYVVVAENAQIVEFFNGGNGYTKLLYPAAKTPNVGSFLRDDGFAAFETAIPNSETNVTTWELYKSEYSTKYGVIDENYADANAYPYVLFLDGNFKGAYSGWATTSSAAAALVKGSANSNKTAYLLVRRDVTIDAACSSLTGIGGTLVIDLGGHTLTRDKLFLDLSPNTTDAGLYMDTNIVVKNGDVRTLKSTIGATQSWVTTKQIAHKTFNLTFENVTIGTAPGATGFQIWTIWANSAPATAYGTTTNITFNDCTFDFSTNYPTGKVSAMVFTDANLVNAVNLVINGGTIKANNPANTTLTTTDANDTVYFGRGSDGNFTTLTTPSGKAPFSGNFRTPDGEYRYFELVSDNGTTASYELKVNKNSTDYGVIGTEYSDAQKYPFVVFDNNGNCIGGYTHLMNTADSDANADAKDAMQYAKNLVHGAGKAGQNVYILMRRDYTLGETGVSETYNNLSQFGGNLIFDLGGYTLNLNEKALFGATKKASGDTVHDTNVKVLNGEIIVGSSSMISATHTAGAVEVRNFNFTFDKVTLTVNKTGVSTSTLLTTSKGAGKGLNLNIDFVDCTFNLDTNVGKSVTLFNMTGTDDNINVTVNIKGGKIVSNAAAMENFTFGKLGSNDKLSFVKLDGEYTALTYPTSDTPTTKTFPTAAGEMYFYKFAQEGVISTYYLRNYGFSKDLIESDPAKYLTVLESPFVIFKVENGTSTYHASYPSYLKAFHAAVGLISGESNKNKTVKIVMLRDSDTGTSADGGSPNVTNVGGTLILDLGGNTLTRSNDRYVFDLFGGNNYVSNIIVENGTILVGTSKNIIGLDHGGGVTTQKTVNFTFNDVTIGYAKGSTGGSLAVVWDTGTGAGTKVNMTFNGCTFDLTNAASGACIFNVSDPGNNNGGSVDVNIVINGGKLVANSFTANQFYKLDSKDSLKLGMDAADNYMYIEMSASAALPAMSFSTVSGNPVSFGLFEKNDLRATYLIGESVETKYGYIPFGYSEKDYPFAVFDEKGNLLGMSAYFYGPNKGDSAIGIAKDYMSGNVWAGNSYGSSPRAAVILMRRDYTFTTDERFDNLAQFQGTVTIDLGGYTLTNAGTRFTFPCTIKPWGGSGDAAVFPTDIVVMNGTMNVASKSIMEIAVWTGSLDSVEQKYFTYTFNNVTFGWAKGGTATSLITAWNTNSSSPTAIGNMWLNFNDCTFNTVGAPDGAILFDNNWEFVNNTVTVKGGKIVANNEEFVIETFNAKNTSSVTFVKDDNGAYTVLELPTNSILASDTVNGGNLKFVKVDEIGNTAIYKLRDSALADTDVTPLASVTLWRDLIFNVYVPKSAALTGFTLDGKTYDPAALETSAVDGKEYYLVSIPLASSEAARTISLTMNVNAGDKSTTVSYTLGVIKYAQIVLERGTEVEKQLASDMLSYVRAAYVYFGKANDAAVAAIDAIIGKDYDKNNAHTAEGSTEASTAGLKGATLVLDATPAIRFYLADGADASAYKFYVGENAVATVTGTDTTGAYVEIDVNAYLMCETVTYTVNGIEGGSYHIASYYKYASEGTDANLTSLVDRLWKYFQSARAYRNATV